LYGIKVVASQNVGLPTYGVHSIVNPGNSNTSRYAVYGKANFTSDAIHDLTALPVGVYGEATNSTGTTNISTSAAGYFLNSSTLGAVSYGVYIKTTAGPSSIVPLRIDHAASELMRVTSAGKVGIGTTSPTNLFHVEATDPVTLVKATSTGVAYTHFVNNGGIFYVGRDDSGGGAFGKAYCNILWGSGGVATVFATGNSEKMRLDTNGRLCINTTSVNNAGYLNIDFNGQNDQGIVLDDTYASLGGAYMIFRNSAGGNAGIISHTETTGIGLYSGENLIFGTAGTERMRIGDGGSVSITQAPGKYTIDTSGGVTSIGNGGTVDFPSASGMLVVNNWSNGHVTIFLCGGGGTAAIGSVGATVGSLAYNAGIGGYTWTNNYGSTTTFGFFFVRTRPYA
jgi:hypothetical protein